MSSNTTISTDTRILRVPVRMTKCMLISGNAMGNTWPDAGLDNQPPIVVGESSWIVRIVQDATGRASETDADSRQFHLTTEFWLPADFCQNAQTV